MPDVVAKHSCYTKKLNVLSLISWVLFAKLSNIIFSISEPYTPQDYCLLSITINCYCFLLINNDRYT